MAGVDIDQATDDIRAGRPLREARTTTCCGCGGALVGIGTVSKIPSDRRKNGRGLCKRIMGGSGCGEADDLKGLAELPA